MLKIVLLRRVYNLIRVWKWRKWKDQSNTRSLYIPTPCGTLRALTYSSIQGKTKPIIIFYHGGGWALGGLKSHHPLCQLLNEKTAHNIISIDYRLAPEHSYPAAHDDALSSAKWIIKHIHHLIPSNGRVIIAGDSAGANLAASTCLALDKHERSIVQGQILLYPVIDHYRSEYASYHEKGKGYALTSNMMQWFWDIYYSKPPLNQSLPTNLDLLNSVKLKDLPPTFIATAENDPLRDEGIAYAVKLLEHNINVTYNHFSQAEHGFACSSGITQDLNVLLNRINTWGKHLPTVSNL